MSAPIDELLIAVRIEQGTDLWAFYKMLKDLQKAAGGNFKNIKDTSWFTRSIWNGMIKRLENIRDCCKGLNELFPTIKQELVEELDVMFRDMMDGIIMGIRDFMQMTIEEQLESNTQVLAELYKDFNAWIDEAGKLLDDIRKDTKHVKTIKEKLAGHKLETHMKSINKNLKYIIDNKKEFEPKIINKLIDLREKLTTIQGTIRYEMGGVYNKVNDLVAKTISQEDLDMTVGTFEVTLSEGIEKVSNILEGLKTSFGGMEDQLRATADGIRKTFVDFEKSFVGRIDSIDGNISSMEYDVMKLKMAVRDSMFATRAKLKRALELATEKGMLKYLPNIEKAMELKMSEMAEMLDAIIKGPDFQEEMGDVIEREIPHPSFGQSEALYSAMIRAEEVDVERLTMMEERQERIKIIEEQSNKILRSQEELNKKQDDALSALDKIDPRDNVAEKSRNQDIRGKKEDMEKG